MQNDPCACLMASALEVPRTAASTEVQPPQSSSTYPVLQAPSIVGRGPRASPGQVTTNCAPFLPSLLWEGLGVWNGVGSQLLP